jgi:hypothetical protein
MRRRTGRQGRRLAPWTWARVTLLIFGLGACVGLASVIPAASALPSYPLYYSFEIPLALPGMTVTDEGVQKSYTGTLRGTLGGLPVQSASFTYGTGASKSVGGGTFSLATAAGEIRDGHILMTTDGKRTTLLFFGVYLGTRIEFGITGDGEQIGGIGVTAIGLARTGFASHDQYMRAIRAAVTSFPPDARAQILSQADTNPSLVRDYQAKSPTH